ncbi:hypothetical protein [Hydrocarboniphaga sp.]|uniref:hypothetical protein n=1 Tax=Hydrocarboniphaga sp. TaxID=2033016 RepID=UPI003D0F3BF7
MLKITGTVSVQETGEGVRGLHVKAVDKDLFFDDVLGTSITGADGRYEITYERKDFAELFERSPELYIVIRDVDNQRIVYSSEQALRCRAGHNEVIDAVLPRSVLDIAAGLPRPPYGPRRGKLQLRLSGGAHPESLSLYFTEHRSEARRQHVIKVRSEKDLSVDLPSGEYSMQIRARGFETYRGLAVVDASKPAVIEATLKPSQSKPRSFEERLAVYGIDARQQRIVDLDVPRGQTRALNAERDREQPGLVVLSAESIAQLKRWTGSDDGRFGHDRPIYGTLPDAEVLEALLRDKLQVERLKPREWTAVKALAREYLHGNSTSVSKYVPLLSQLIKAVRVPLYFYRVVTINAGATLEVGNGSAVFSCDELRIHKTGSLKPVNSVKIEIGTWKEFQ